jgi:hypothetical protein
MALLCTIDFHKRLYYELPWLKTGFPNNVHRKSFILNFKKFCSVVYALSHRQAKLGQILPTKNGKIQAIDIKFQRSTERKTK